MSIYTVQLQELKPVPLAVIRRTASARELSRVIPECCGLVWDVVSALQRRGGRHVAVYWDGAIRLEVGVELLGSFADQGEVVRSARSEEHTSELQSRGHLVCRLLLEKK